jgi:hypothetical protein
MAGLPAQLTLGLVSRRNKVTSPATPRLNSVGTDERVSVSDGLSAWAKSVSEAYSCNHGFATYSPRGCGAEFSWRALTAMCECAVQ